MSFIVTVAYIICISILVMSISRLIHERRIVPDEVHFAPTTDGYEVAVYRYRPSKINPKREPVIICHGLTANHKTFDPGPFPSLARHLKREGFDVYTIDLRGRGLSSKPESRRGRPLAWGWTFDDYVRYDLPAAIKYVRRLTGSDEVQWVGHSMGGMVMYAYLQEHPDGGGVKAATTIGSPGNFTRAKQYAPFVPTAGPFLRARQLHFRPMAHLFGPLAYILPTQIFGMERGVYPWMSCNLVSSPSTGVMKQFHYWVKHATFCNKDDSVVYADGFHKIKKPIMTMTSAKDMIVHPADVRYVSERLGGQNNKHVFFSKKNGGMANYDHVSIVVSQAAQREVYPIITDWLKEHSTV